MKQVRGTAIGTKFAPPYAIHFMAALEENILSKVKKKQSAWWRYIVNIFFIYEHGEQPLKEFINDISSFDQTIKFIAGSPKEEVKYLESCTLFWFIWKNVKETDFMGSCAFQRKFSQKGEIRIWSKETDI